MDSRAVSLKSGLTLIEILFVVAITGILAALAVPSYRNYTERVRATQAIVLMIKRPLEL